MLLAGDIGGTKTALGVFSPDAGARAPLAEATFPSGVHGSLEEVVQEFLRQQPHPIDRASFGVAGPVVEGTAKITNLPWTIDETRLRDTLGIPQVRIVNDLVAIASAVPILAASDLHTLNEGRAVPKGAIAVIAPGTGLGESFLTWGGNRYHAHASEGGHSDFAPRGATQRGLLEYLARDGSHVSCERVCSGLGVPHLYAYLKSLGAALEPAWLGKQLTDAEDPTPAIVAAATAHDPPAELARAALTMFVSILGAEAGNVALKVLSTGGVYLGGGMSVRVLPMLEGAEFKEAFCDKGRMSALLGEMPVHVITRPDVALTGAAQVGLDL
jgi:glucokinase